MQGESSDRVITEQRPHRSDRWTRILGEDAPEVFFFAGFF
jgi:hypothetical protein